MVDQRSVINSVMVRDDQDCVVISTKLRMPTFTFAPGKLGVLARHRYLRNERIIVGYHCATAFKYFYDFQCWALAHVVDILFVGDAAKEHLGTVYSLVEPNVHFLRQSLYYTVRH